MELYLETTTGDDTAVRTALILAKTRYDKTLAPFVGTSKARLSYVSDQIERIARECATAASADPATVEEKFKAILAEAVAVSEPEKQDVSDGDGVIKNLEGEWSEEDAPYDTRMDIKDHGAVLEEEALTPDGSIDLPSNEFGSPSEVSWDLSEVKRAGSLTECAACGEHLNPVIAHFSVTCEKCSNDIMGYAPGPAGTATQPATQDPSMGMNCQNPVNCQAQNGQCSYPGCSSVTSANENEAVDEAVEPLEEFSEEEPVDETSDVAIIMDLAEALEGATPEQKSQIQDQIQSILNDSDPLTEEPTDLVEDSEDGADVLLDDVEEEILAKVAADNPTQVFDDVVYEIANRMAALKWSQVSDQDVMEIAQAKGMDEEEIRSSLKIQATFGDVTAINGSLVEGDETGDLEEMTDFGGRIPAEQVEVPLGDAINLTASKTAMAHDDVYQLVQENYHGELADTYTISVTGTAQYFLPGASSVPDVDEPHELSPESPTPPGVVSSLADYLRFNAAQLRKRSFDDEPMPEAPPIGEVSDEPAPLDLPTEPFSSSPMGPEDVANNLPEGWSLMGIFPREAITGEGEGFLWGASSPAFNGGQPYYAADPDTLISEIMGLEDTGIVDDVDDEGNVELEDAGIPVEVEDAPLLPEEADVLVV